MPAEKLTTTRGVCRVCGHRWKVPKTEIGPHKIRRILGLSYYEGIDQVCPQCKRPEISWLYDDQSMAPDRPIQA